MGQPIRYESIQEPIDEEERELMDPDNWDWENPIEVVVSDDLTIVLEIEVTPEEHTLIAQAAAAQGLTTHSFMKELALAAAREGSPEMAVASVTRQTREWRSG